MKESDEANIYFCALLSLKHNVDISMCSREGENGDDGGLASIAAFRQILQASQATRSADQGNRVNTKDTPAAGSGK